MRRKPHKDAMNELKMSLQHSILTLWNHGWSFRRIARELQLRRETVSKYVRRDQASKAAKVSPGSEGGTEPKPAKVPAGSPGAELAPEPAKVPVGLPVRSRSQCEPWRDFIERGLQAGLSAQRLYQDLVGEHQFVGSYDAVKRFVRRLQAAWERPFCRMEVEPGAEAQVDFGLGAWVLVEGKRKRPHLFRIVLSHSRKGYSEVVWRQTTESFIRCLENSFRHYGGVPKTLVIDNLRAAVTRADWFDPELNAKVAEFCQHYGTAMLPTRPAMPRHKGKIEAGVKFAQNNALKGRSFTSLAEQNRFLSDWESRVADTRIHGTTRQQVGKVFNEVERPKLSPLPAGLFPVFEEAPRTVHRDGHIELGRAYYSVPPEYVGRQVWARWESRLVRVFNQRREVIAVHVRVEPGKFATDQNHLHSPYRHIVQHGLDYLLDRARLVGPGTGSWAEGMVQQRGPIGVRVLHGLLSLAQKHPVQALEAAAQKALHHGVWRLRDLRALLEQAGPAPQLDFLETHPLIRNLDTYRDCVPDCFAPSTLNPEPSPSP
jgi:transposase